MDYISYSDIETLNNEYSFLVKNKTDILNELDFIDEDDRLLTESIINNLERHASENIKNNNIVQLPYIGVIRKSPLREVMRSNYDNFRQARKTMNKEEYKTYVANIINEGKQKIKEAEDIKYRFKRLISRNKKTYDRYYINLGKNYANVYILALSLLDYVEFNQEVQDMYDYLRTL